MRDKKSPRGQVKNSPPTLNTLMTAELWDMGINMTREMLEMLHIMEARIALKTLRGWKVNRDKAMSIVGTELFQKAYERTRCI